MDSNILIEKLIVHILDAAVGSPILSDFNYEIDSDMYEYIEKHVFKIFKDIELKKVYFTNDENLFNKNCLKFKHGEEDFIQVTKNIASRVYELMDKNSEIPSADLVCTLFKKDNSKYLGFLKLNYKESYIHYIDESQGGREVRIVKQKTALPLATQKVDECILVNMEDFSILLKEKKYEIDGEKQFYLSTQILESTETLSDKEKIDIINKASKRVVKKYCNDDVTKIAEIKNAIAQGVEDDMIINIEEVGDKVFKGNPEMQQIYNEEIEKRGLKEKTLSVNENIEKKVMKKQRLVTGDGIEIKLPASFLSRKDKVEFMANMDGTISILLKNISEIEDK